MRNAVVWLVCSGAPWRDLPDRYGLWSSVYSMFRKWIDDGILDNIFRILNMEAGLYELSIDASIVHAHQHSAGANKASKQDRIQSRRSRHKISCSLWLSSLHNDQRRSAQ